MKTDLTTSILAAIVGAAIAFFVCNLLVPELENVSIKNLSETTSYSLSQPDVDVFNFRALNPTVEVYVGQCQNFDANGNCIDDQTTVQNADDENVDEGNNSGNENTESSDNTDQGNTDSQQETQNGGTN